MHFSTKKEKKLSLHAPLTQTYQLATIAKINKNPIKRKLSILFADTLSGLNILVRTSCPCAVPNPVRSTTPSPVGRVDRGLQPRTGCAPGASLEDFGAAEEDGTFVLTVDVQVIFALEELDGLFEEWVDLPESMALLTMLVPEMRRMLAGMVVSACWRTCVWR